MAPTAQLRIELVYQLLSSYWRASAGKLAHLILETADRLLPRVRIERSRRGRPTQLTVAQLSWSPALDLIPQELKSETDVHDPGLLRIQLHSQPFQNPEGVGHSRARV